MTIGIEKCRKLAEEIRKILKELKEFPPYIILFVLIFLGLFGAYGIKLIKMWQLIILFAVALVICCLFGCLFGRKHQEKPSPPPPLSPPTSSEKYFFGIDIGSENIEYCILDCSLFEQDSGNNNKCFNPEPLYENSRKTPHRNMVYGVEEICKATSEIIYELADWAKSKAKKPICGIGIGLPGMVDPVNGELVKSPNLNWNNVRFIHHLEHGDVGHYKGLDWSRIKGVIPIGAKSISIKIDNDVRCATRFMWKRCPEDNKNMVCVFIGNGLGSGIVLNGKMFYGKQFYAGEAGHTIISSIIPAGIPLCHCKEPEGPWDGHWEAHVCSYGMVSAMENLLNDPKRISLDVVKNFKRDYLPAQKEVNTYIIRDAYYNNNPCAMQIVSNFFEYVAIGVANYINILNPDIVYLGGGMVRGFFWGHDSMPAKISREDFIKKMSGIINEPDKLWEEMENKGYLDNGWPTIRFNEDEESTRFKKDFENKYSDGNLSKVIGLLKENSLQKPVEAAFFDMVKKRALPNLDRNNLHVEASEKRYLASMGAALIFKDKSYEEYCSNK